MKKGYQMFACLLLAGVCLRLGTIIVSAQTTTNYNFLFSANAEVPQGDPSGLALTEDVTGVGGVIDNLSVSLDISGGFNGDLYAYLRGPNGGFAVLLNRVGVSSGNAFGYSDTGFNVTFNDSISYDNIHYYQNSASSLNADGQLTGTWSSDGRNIDPQSDPSLFDTTQPTATLQSFDATNPNGTWTLFVADFSSGGQSTVVNWGLDIGITPEPSTCSLLIFGAGILFCAKKYMQRSS